MDTPRHCHFDEISADLDPIVAERHLDQVADQAAAMCRELAACRRMPSPV
jgi:hypothetical protein